MSMTERSDDGDDRPIDDRSMLRLDFSFVGVERSAIVIAKLLLLSFLYTRSITSPAG